jgi:hypothetical protein
MTLPGVIGPRRGVSAAPSPVVAAPSPVMPVQAGIHSPKRVAILGAPGTGKTQLARELSEHLRPSACDLLVLDGEGLPGDATLVMGLDLPSASGGEAADARLRTRLQSAGVAFQVVYGVGAQRLRAALVALTAAGVLPPGLVRRHEEGGAAGWIGACEKCSDPACEHRLFTRLRQERDAPARGDEP